MRSPPGPRLPHLVWVFGVAAGLIVGGIVAYGLSSVAVAAPAITP